MNAELLAGNIAAHWVQAGILAVSALLAMRLLLLREPRARLAALHLTLVAIVLLPACNRGSRTKPALQVTPETTAIDLPPIIRRSQSHVRLPVPREVSILRSRCVTGRNGHRACDLIWLLYGVVRLPRLSRAASAVEPPDVAWALEAELGVSPRYIQQIGSRGPWTFGFLRPTIALPAGFDALVPAFQRSVICHELAHVKRRDMAVAFCEELAVAALWFHPWIWLLRARIRVAREQVVDGQVVALLGNRDEYVRCLVDISGHDLAPHFSQAGAGMLRPRELRARVDAIFQEAHMSRTRFAVAALSFVAVTAGTGLIAIAAMPLRASSLVSAATSNEPLPLLVSRFLITEGSATAISWTAAAQPQAARSQAASDAPRTQINTVYPEYPQDALERGIRGTVIVDITVNPAGEVTTAAVASGPQELRASAFKAALGLKYTKGSSTTATEDRVRLHAHRHVLGREDRRRARNIGPRFTAIRQGAAASADSTANPDETGAYRVGGNFLPPKKLKDVPAEYPEAAKEARVQGIVIVEVRIDERGTVTDVANAQVNPVARSGGDRRGQAMAIHANADERRRCASSDDCYGELHAAPAGTNPRGDHRLIGTARSTDHPRDVPNTSSSQISDGFI